MMRQSSMTGNRTMTVIGLAIGLAIGLVWGPGLPTARALPMAGHLHGRGDLGGILDLAGTPVGKGGIGPASAEQARAVGLWMDNPATRIGQSRNHMAGGDILSPWNHRGQRHNPVQTARVFSGDGSISPGVLNQARMHKLQDIAAAKGVEGGRAFVDGHQVTPQMQEKAQAILRHTRRYKRLPPRTRLPEWLDNSGPGIGSTRGSAATARTTLKTAKIGAKSMKTGPNARTLAGGKAVAIPLVVAVLAAEAYGTETAYVNGELDASQRTAKHAASGVGMAGGLAGVKAGTCAGAAIGTFILPGVGTAIGGFVGGIAGGAAGYVGARSTAEHVGDRWCKEAAAEEEMLKQQWQAMYPDPL